ncbi:DUF4435 domain-containing protein [Gracilibacillus salitolerans]|nr:DUF4435 domain-containing protein [Gracilibacillus salitolerans]
MIRPDELDLKDNIAELEIHLKSNKKIFIVEGKGDLDYFKLLLDRAEEVITPFVVGDKSTNNCRGEIINIFDVLPEVQNNPNVIGIIDRDFNQNTFDKFTNLKQTEYCDLDCYYVYGSNFNNFVSQLVSHYKITNKIGFNPLDNIDHFREYLLECLLPLTKMRLKNDLLNIPFNRVLKKSPIQDRKDRHKKFLKFLNDDFTINMNVFYTYLSSNGSLRHFECQELLDVINSFQVTNKLHVSNGHDLISLITAIIKSYRNDYDDIKTEEALRLTMNIEVFEEFELTRSVKKWILSSCEKKEAVS